jgi:hypothetical protein
MGLRETRMPFSFSDFWMPLGRFHRNDGASSAGSSNSAVRLPAARRMRSEPSGLTSTSPAAPLK